MSDSGAITTDRASKARLVRRRLADMREADRLRSRGWTCVPPADAIQREIEEKP